MYRLRSLKKRRELKQRIYGIFNEAVEPQTVMESYDQTLHRSQVIDRYGPAIKKLKQLLTRNKIKLNRSHDRELNYLLQRTSQSVYKLHGMVSVALEKCHNKSDFSKYFSAIVGFEYQEYPYKDISNDVLLNCQDTPRNNEDRVSLSYQP